MHLSTELDCPTAASETADFKSFHGVRDEIRDEWSFADLRERRERASELQHLLLLIIDDGCETGLK